MNDPIPVPIKGKRKKRVLISSRKLEQIERAKRRLNDLTNEVILNNPLASKAVCPPSPLKACKDLVDEYFENQPHLAAKTAKERRRGLNVLIRFVGPKPISRGLIEEFNAELHKTRDYEAGGRWLIGSCVAMFLNWLWDSKRIDSDWRAGIHFPTQPRQQPRKPYTTEEVRKLIEAAEERPLGFVIKLGYATGFALVDCCQLLWGQCDLERCTITKDRQKTGVEAISTFPFGGELYQALLKQRDDTIGAFNSAQPGLPVCRAAYNNKISIAISFARLCKKTGVENRGFHALRATFLTDLASSNTPLNVSLKAAGLCRTDQLMAYVSTRAEDMRGHLERVRK